MFAELKGRGGLWYRSGIGAFKWYARALDLRLWQIGPGVIPESGPFLLVANHTSYLDSFCIGAVCRPAGRQIRVLVKRSLFETPLIRRVMIDMGHVPVSRATASTDAVGSAVRVLAEGTPVGLFPEGTISRSFTVQPFQTGALRIATAAQVPIVPIVIWGPHRLYTVDKHLHATRRVPIVVHVGESFTHHLRDDPGVGQRDGQQSVRADTEVLQATMAATLRQVQRTYAAVTRPEPGAWWMPAELGGGAPSPEAARRIDLGRRRVERTPARG